MITNCENINKSLKLSNVLVMRVAAERGKKGKVKKGEEKRKGIKERERWICDSKFGLFNGILSPCRLFVTGSLD